MSPSVIPGEIDQMYLVLKTVLYIYMLCCIQYRDEQSQIKTLSILMWNFHVCNVSIIW
jgi:hypothetical protein